MRHLIANAVRVPAERQFGKVSGADHDAVVEIGQAEEVAGALASLHVFEGDIVYRIAAETDDGCPLSICMARGPNIDLFGRYAQGLHQPPRVGFGFIAGGKARHRVRQHVLPGQSQPIHRPAAHNQRLRRIQPSGNANHDFLNPVRRQPLLQPGT